MKTLLSILLCVLTLTVNSQTSLIFKEKSNDLLVMNTSFKSSKFESKVDFSEKMEINMRLPKYREPNEMKTTGLCIFLGGIAFTTAAILESGDFKIYQGETARQIMLGVGIGLTITGSAIAIKN